MRNLIVKIKKAVELIEKERGIFDVKCLVTKNPDEISWDLILSADWFGENQLKDAEYLSQKILSDFDIDDMLQFSSIVILRIEKENELLDELKRIQAYENSRTALGRHFWVETPLEQARFVIPIRNAATDVQSGIAVDSEKTVATA